MALHSVTTEQKRALFFVFDGGTGLGHLRRLAHIAKRLQGRFACLIVTGHRAPAHWFVPDECEYIHLPSWDSLVRSKANYWGREPFISMTPQQAVQLRKGILHGVIDAFGPDVLFVDHLPLGAHGELTDIIKHAPCMKYLVTRGVLNETEDLGQLILGGEANQCLKLHYHKILVAIDPQVFDFQKRYNISADIRAKTIPSGYVIEGVSEETIQRTREDRGLAPEDIWVVASAGSGQLGEPLVTGCLDLAAAHENIFFDIVRGPRSRLPWSDPCRTTVVNNRLHYHKDTYCMPFFHAAADVVINSGGYNSLLEALQGRAKILCFPYRRDRRDEQYQHATLLKKFVDLAVSTDLGDLTTLFESAIESLRNRRFADRRRELDFNGSACIERIVLNDLGMNDESASPRTATSLS